MNRHAYLIMAHNEFDILEKQLKLLDDENNDIYLHIDKKVKNFDFTYFKRLVKKATLTFTKRIDVRWSCYSQIACELLLLTEATKTFHKYYHLLSGIDLPVKSQKEIQSFFNNTNKEFIHYRVHEKFQKTGSLANNRLDRVDYYHLFFKNARSNSKIKKKLAQKLHSIALKIQKKLHIHRIKDKEYFRDGANWFSITHELALYVVDHAHDIKKRYKFTYCADEMFLQTLVYHSKFYQNLYSYKDDDYDSIKRVIDWKRGNPYIFRIDDFDDLVNSRGFFARKFSSKVDKEIIDKLYEKGMKDNGKS